LSVVWHDSRKVTPQVAWLPVSLI